RGRRHHDPRATHPTRPCLDDRHQPRNGVPRVVRVSTAWFPLYARKINPPQSRIRRSGGQCIPRPAMSEPATPIEGIVAFTFAEGSDEAQALSPQYTTNAIDASGDFDTFASQRTATLRE